jgi:hypothetical protein
VADVFDALTHERPYKPAWPVEEAVAEIARQSGTQLDRDVVAAFLRVVARGAIDDDERPDPPRASPRAAPRDRADPPPFRNTCFPIDPAWRDRASRVLERGGQWCFRRFFP